MYCHNWEISENTPENSSIGTGVLHPGIFLIFFFLSTKISVTRESKVFLDTCFLWLVFALLAWVNAEF